MNKFIYYFNFIIFFNINLYSSEQSNILNTDITQFEKKYGERAKNRLDSYYDFLGHIKTKSTKEQLKAINNFFNRFQYKKDMHNWKKSEYWADIKEFIGKGSGDCEDYAIAKYFTLLHLGIPSKKLKISYSKLMKKGSKKQIPHIVLTYYDKRDSTPVVLDNTLKDIIPASKRKDLKIITNPNIDKQIEQKLSQLKYYKI